MLNYCERSEIPKLVRFQRCATCGGRVAPFLDPGTKQPFVACADWLRTKHEGIEQIPSDYRGMESLNILARREIMVATHGEEKTNALAKYQSITMMTKQTATEIVNTLWGTAPSLEKTKAIMICATYNLNPLMNHIFLLPFENKKTGKTDYAVAIGIEATRLMARRKHRYTYLDMTPRRATDEELDKLIGKEKIDPEAIYQITKLKDLENQAEAYGLGIWKGFVYGADKGNTPSNMAAIRSERAALKRLYPAEMPSDIEVVDEAFAQTGAGIVDKETGEIFEGECREVAEKAVQPPPDSKKLNRDPAAIKSIGGLTIACKEDFPDQVKYQADMLKILTKLHGKQVVLTDIVDPAAEYVLIADAQEK